MTIKTLILFIIFFVAPFSVSANIYYVSPSGLDTNNGSQSSPWKTVQKAADMVSAGDIVNVLDGDYSEKITINRSGSIDMPIIFQAQGSVKTKGFSVGGVNPADYITIKNFRIENSIGKGIEVFGKGCVIENNYIYYSSDGGILLRTSSGDLMRTADCVVKNNRLERNAQFGIDVRGRNHLIEGNEIWDTIQHHPNRVPSPTWADADGIHFHGSGHTFKNNYIHDIKYDGVSVINAHIDCFQTFDSLPYQEKATNIIFEKNRCILPYYKEASAATNGFMLRAASYLTIRNNIIYTYSGLNTGGGGNNYLTILNNTWIGIVTPTFLSKCHVGLDCWPTGITFENSSNNIVKNNIFYNKLYKAIELKGTSANLEEDYNLVYQSDGAVPNGRLNLPNSQHDLWGIDPYFINTAIDDYHLKNNSFAINSGLNLENVKDDYEGNSRPQGLGYDIGAYEYNGGNVQPTFTPIPTSIPNTPTPIPPTLYPTPTPIPGDIDHNKIVDMNDYNTLLTNFGKIGDNQADVNKNGRVDIYDYNFVIKNFGMKQ